MEGLVGGPVIRWFELVMASCRSIPIQDAAYFLRAVLRADDSSEVGKPFQFILQVIDPNVVCRTRSITSVEQKQMPMTWVSISRNTIVIHKHELVAWGLSYQALAHDCPQLTGAEEGALE